MCQIVAPSDRGFGVTSGQGQPGDTEGWMWLLALSGAGRRKEPEASPRRWQGEMSPLLPPSRPPAEPTACPLPLAAAFCTKPPLCIRIVPISVQPHSVCAPCSSSSFQREDLQLGAGMAKAQLQSFMTWPFAAWHAAFNLERSVLALLHAEICCPDELIPDYMWVWTSAGQNLDTLV